MPARRLATLRGGRRARRSPSPPGSWSASARRAATSSPPCRPSPPSHARHGHVQEVIVQNFLPKPGRPCAGPRRARPRTCLGHRRGPPGPAARRPRAGAANLSDDLAPLLARRHRRLGRRLAGHGRPREPRAGLAGARRAARRPPRRPGTRWRPPDRLPGLRPRPRALARPGPALPGARRVRRRRPRPRPRRGARAARRRRPRLIGPAADAPGAALVATLAAAPWPRCWRRGAWARRSARTRSSRCSAPAAPRSASVAEVADDLRRDIGRRRRHLRAQPQHQLHQRLHVQVPLLRLLQGPALAQPARGALPPRARRDHATGSREAEAEGATEVCLQGGIHPNFDGDYYLHVLEAVRAGLDRHPHPRLHRARGHRGRTPLRGAAGRVPDRA